MHSRHAKVWELRGLEREGVERFFLRPFHDRADVGWTLSPSEIELVQQRLSHDGRRQGQAHPLAMVLLATVADGRQLAPIAVLQQHPNGDKAPDAGLKRGLCLIELNRMADGIIQLQHVKDSYPGSAASRLAREKLESLGLM